MGKVLLYSIFFFFLVDLQLKATEDPPAEAKSIVKDSADVLTAFSARIKDNKIHINWHITNLREISYFEVQKHDSKTKLFETINVNDRLKASDYIEQSTDDNNQPVFKYNFEDDPEKDGVYFYRIKAINASGKLVFVSDEIKIGVTGLRDFSLGQNKPNPFNPSTQITYVLTNPTHVSLKVYDLIGREVATLVDQMQSAGEYTVEFDASKYGSMTSGIYFYKLETEKYSEVKKMILAK